ncbi:hypothetical protein LFYK43_16260 [Ligilactobacillus salitolerans]|uniref:DUF1310 domain-containing protein n=1 Tax=Ligilactobacillus salitolerans TaxID=1808352 RepID=A0A401IUK7_9LACO|nr:DUF1310 family protein [Ligilactobacillus salitolerans]GBG95167.1 hypothetical protein LFYK43_16260 [Ligilactobacillus salitolerans]
MKKKTKIILFSIIMSVVLIIGVFAGGKYYLNKKEERQHEEMVSYVKKYHKLIEDEVIDMDKRNSVHEITLRYNTIEHNPMGGINVKGYVNDNKSLVFYANLDKITVNGQNKMDASIGGTSPELAKILGE